MILIVKSHSGLSRRLAFSALAICVCALSACGQQGPLYLPDTQMPHGKAAKRTKGAPGLPPAKADASQADKPAQNDDSTAIVPVTPSIPD